MKAILIMTMKQQLFLLSLLGLVSIQIFTAGCLGTVDNEVVVFAALDKEFSEPVLKDFEQQTGIKVRPKYDQESNKTVGLANEIINQRNRQRADLFWNNEILHSLRLKKLGLLEVYQSPQAANYPPAFVSSDNDWHGFAARARVLIVNTDLLPNAAERPKAIAELTNPKWKDKCAMALPLFGTTATQAAVLFSSWGESRATEFFRKVSKNAVIESGNKQVAQKVAQGRYVFGITDTDDAIIELERGEPVAIIFPDQGDLQQGTLLIPNTLCVIKNGPNTENAKKLIDFLLQAEIEDRLASSASAQIPLNSTSKTRSRVSPEEKLRIMPVDFEAAAEQWDTASRVLREIFPVGG